MNTLKRVAMVRAMELVMRQLNDEDIFMSWLVEGVADGDAEQSDLYIAETYCDDETFKELMGLFVSLMYRVGKDQSGLYCDDVLSNEEDYIQC